MEDTIPTQFWGLYATGEFKLVQQFCELGKALESLGSTATEQESSIPDCPACEIWFSAFCPVQKFVENFPESLPSNFEKGLQHIFALGNGLSEAALRCGDRSIFSNPEWEPTSRGKRGSSDDGLGVSEDLYKRLAARVPARNLKAF